jgi:hypothetical protein
LLGTVPATSSRSARRTHDRVPSTSTAATVSPSSSSNLETPAADIPFHHRTISSRVTGP